MFIPSLCPLLAAWLRPEARRDDLQASWSRRKEEEEEPEPAEVGDRGLPQAAPTFSIQAAKSIWMPQGH